MMTTERVCNCDVCIYRKKIRDLIYRTHEAADKAIIEELYSFMINAEDDRDYYRILCEAYRYRNGIMSFTDACHAVEEKRSKEWKA